MTDKKDNAELPRRDFLKVAGVASVAAALAVVPKKEAEAASPEPQSSAGYRETEHIRTYYETTKF